MEVLKSLEMEVKEIKEHMKELRHVVKENENKAVRREGKADEERNHEAVYGAGDEGQSGVCVQG